MTNRRHVAIACFTAFAVMGITSSILGPTLTNLAASIALPIENAGILRAAQQIGMFVATMVGGYFLNRFSPRVVLVPGVILMALGMVGGVTTGHVNIALLAFTLMGIGTGLLNLGGNVAISVMFAENASPVLAALHTCFGIGLFVGPLIAEQTLRQPDNWRWSYFIPAVLCLVLGAAFALIHMDAPRRAETTSPAGEKTASAVPILWLPLVPLIVLLFTYTGAGNGIADWIATHLQLVALSTPDTAAQVTSLYGAMLTAGRAVSIYALSRFGNMRVLAAAIGIATIGALVILLAGAQVELVAVGVALVGLGFSPIYPTVIALVGQQQPENRGAVTAIAAGTASIGGIVVPVVHGWAGAGKSGGMVVTFISTLVMIVSIIAIQSVESTRARQKAQPGEV